MESHELCENKRQQDNKRSIDVQLSRIFRQFGNLADRVLCRYFFNGAARECFSRAILFRDEKKNLWGSRRVTFTIHVRKWWRIWLFEPRRASAKQTAKNRFLLLIKSWERAENLWRPAKSNVEKNKLTRCWLAGLRWITKKKLRKTTFMRSRCRPACRFTLANSSRSKKRQERKKNSDSRLRRLLNLPKLNCFRLCWILDCGRIN